LLQKTPADPFTHAARYMSDPWISNKVANFLKPEDLPPRYMVDRDTEIYAAATVDPEGPLVRLIGKFRINELSPSSPL